MIIFLEDIICGVCVCMCTIHCPWDRKRSVDEGLLTRSRDDLKVVL